jgi:hypothetical protein
MTCRQNRNFCRNSRPGAPVARLRTLLISIDLPAAGGIAATRETVRSSQPMQGTFEAQKRIACFIRFVAVLGETSCNAVSFCLASPFP